MVSVTDKASLNKLQIEYVSLYGFCETWFEQHDVRGYIALCNSTALNIADSCIDHVCALWIIMFTMRNLYTYIRTCILKHRIK
jgi:hypothetical protein